MRQEQQQTREGSKHMNQAAVADEARLMLHELSQPIQPTDSIKARRERAIRRAGISHAKGARLWYGQTCSLLAHEFLKIADAYRRHIDGQERELAARLERIRKLREERQQQERP